MYPFCQLGAQIQFVGSVDGVFNAISIHGDVVGETVYIGPGAGRHATLPVISDIVDAVKLLIVGGPQGRFPFLDPAPKNGANWRSPVQRKCIRGTTFACCR